MILYDMMMIIYDDDHHRITPRWKFVKKNLEFSRNEILAGNCVNDYAWKINGSNISSNGFMVHLLFLQKLSLISETSYVTIFDRQFFRRHNTGFFLTVSSKKWPVVILISFIPLVSHVFSLLCSFLPENK